MTNPIPPSKGRVVLVRSADWEGDAPGIVNAVHSNECIDVFVMPKLEVAHTRSSIVYAEDHDASGQSISFHWMDYQIKVAAERDPNSGEVAGASPVRDDGGYARQRAMEYAIEIWKHATEEFQSKTTVLKLAEEYSTFIIGQPPAE